MSDFTPPLEYMRDAYVIEVCQARKKLTEAQAETQFDRAIAKIRADAKREARDEWANHIETWDGTVGGEVCNVENIVTTLRSPHTPFGISENPDA